MARNKFDVDERLETPFNAKHLKKMLVYVKRYRKPMIFAFLMSAVSSVAVLYGPKILQWVLDEAVPNKDVALLLRLGVMYLVFIIISTLLKTFQHYIMAHVSQNIIFDIRHDLFAHLQKLPFSYYDSRPAGKILVRVINYVNSVSDILSNGIINSIIDILNVIFIIIFMFMTDVTLAAVVVGGIPLLILVMLFLKPAQRKAWQQVSNKNSNFTAYLAENIEGVRVTQLFARQDKNISVMSGLVDECRKANIKARILGDMLGVSSEMINQIVFSFMYVAGVYWLFGGRMVSFGVILAMGQYLGRLWTPINNLASIYNSFINNIAYLERICEVLDEPVTVADLPDAVELGEITGSLSFNDVTFSYDGTVNVLEDLSFDVKPGESIALVGQTGAGKTTIVNLISRFYNVNGGSICLGTADGGSADISHITLKSLRRHMGIMMQDSFIFSGTIMDNIRYGRLDATDEEVMEAAKHVCAHNFIMQMSRGYDTPVRENGSGLSQGQKQLIAFARTMLSDPDILILDEATSSIDTKTEKLLQKAIAEILKGRTSFIVAHRLSTIKNCDRIFVVGDKGIIESGSHDELIKKRGHYYELYTAQTDM